MKTRKNGITVTPDAFWAHVVPEPNSGCWLFAGGNEDRWGYGRLYMGTNAGRMLTERAHRFALAISTATAIPDGAFVLHGCDTPACVNPDHLRLGTAGENAADKKRRGRGRNIYSRGATCIHGHERSAVNVYVTPSGRRQCRPCNANRTRKYQTRIKADAA